MMCAVSKKIKRPLSEFEHLLSQTKKQETHMAANKQGNE
jgi:hypothetical protein